MHSFVRVAPKNFVFFVCSLFRALMSRRTWWPRYTRCSFAAASAAVAGMSSCGASAGTIDSKSVDAALVEPALVKGAEPAPLIFSPKSMAPLLRPPRSRLRLFLRPLRPCSPVRAFPRPLRASLSRLDNKLPQQHL